MLVNGWICLHRKMQNWEWFKSNSDIFKVFVYLVFNANTGDKKWQAKYDVKRGQLITSLSTICSDTGLTIRAVRTVLSHLEKTGEISIKATNKNSIITICNYDAYQNQKTESDTQTDTPSDIQTDTPTDTPSDTPTDNNVTINNITINKKQKNIYQNLGANAPLSSGTTAQGDTPTDIPENDPKNEDADTLTLMPPTANAEKKKSCAQRKKDDAIDFDALKEFFNNTMQGRGIHQITSITGKRQQAVAARAREHGKNAIATVIENAAKSKFLNAETQENFLADFNWLFRPENFVKVLEGKYTNRDRAPMQPRPAKLSGAGAALAAYEELQQKYEQQNGNNNADTDNGSHSTDAATDYLLTLNGF